MLINLTSPKYIGGRGVITAKMRCCIMLFYYDLLDSTIGVMSSLFGIVNFICPFCILLCIWILDTTPWIPDSTLDSRFQLPRLTEERVLNGPCRVIRDRTLYPLFKELPELVCATLINRFDWRWYLLTMILVMHTYRMHGFCNLPSFWK